MASRIKKIRLAKWAKVEDIDATNPPWSYINKLADANYYKLRAIESITAGHITEAQQFLALARMKENG